MKIITAAVPEVLRSPSNLVKSRREYLEVQAAGILVGRLKGQQDPSYDNDDDESSLGFQGETSM